MIVKPGFLLRSPTLQHYGIEDFDDVRAYLADPALYARINGRVPSP